MANSTSPLLSKSDSSELEIPDADATQPNLLDELVEWCIGGLDSRQILQAMLVSLAWFFDGQQAYISDFTDAEPTWHCTGTANTTCDSSSDVCDLSDSSWAWDGPAYKSIISEWALECANYFITGLPTSCFYLGCLIGGFAFATLADSSLGRKNLLVLSCLIMSLAALATSFSPDVWVYSALRFVSGFGRYLLRDASWRYLYVATSTPALIYTSVTFFLVRESPKWLFMQGRDKEALATLTRFAPPTKHSRLKQYLSRLLHEQETTKSGLYSSLKYILDRRWASARLLKVMALGFGTGMMDYGILLGVGNLGFDLYLSVTFNALVILPSYVASYFLIDRWKRRDSVLSFTMLSGSLSIICAILGSGSLLEIGFELGSFFCTCVAYNVLLIYTIELFPTRVRNSATSMMRQAVVLGVLLDPTLISAGRDMRCLTFLVFGVTIICCGCMAVFLPETLCDALDEQEQRITTTS
ncbi:organic cation/carnitine transporter 3-like [Syzygium oleosum]|uniref:organic cation/carnitine transporter 3-like n=1 Tax=Syzygium oleosum TaxID=219896 RepID=UPI0024BBB2EE|nr:organic cation/carnitine transporter 3-like [Syzygium oleosum]